MLTVFASFFGGYCPHFAQVHHSPGQRASTFGSSMGLQFGYLQPDSSKRKDLKHMLQFIPPTDVILYFCHL